MSTASRAATREADARVRGKGGQRKPGSPPPSDYRYIDRLQYLHNGPGFVYDRVPAPLAGRRGQRRGIPADRRAHPGDRRRLVARTGPGSPSRPRAGETPTWTGSSTCSWSTSPAGGSSG